MGFLGDRMGDESPLNAVYYSRPELLNSSGRQRYLALELLPLKHIIIEFHR